MDTKLLSQILENIGDIIMNLYMTENQKRKLTEVVTLIPENVKDILQEIRIPAYNIENGGVTKKFDMYLIFSNEAELPESVITFLSDYEMTWENTINIELIAEFDGSDTPAGETVWKAGTLL